MLLSIICTHCIVLDRQTKWRSFTISAEYIQTLCPHYSALRPHKPGVHVL